MLPFFSVFNDYVMKNHADVTHLEEKNVSRGKYSNTNRSDREMKKMKCFIQFKFTSNTTHTIIIQVKVCKNIKVPLSDELVSFVFPKRNSYLALATLCACAEELLTRSNASPCKNKPQLNLHALY